MQDRKPVETREARLNSTVSFGGGCQAFAQGGRQRCLKYAPRSFSQATVCQELYSIMTLFTVRNAVVVVHGPAGCSSCAIGLNSFHRKGNLMRGNPGSLDAAWYATDLGEREIILGGEEKLRAAVLLAEQQRHPEAIFILTTCVSGIIGDPVADIAGRLQSEVRARLVPVHCEGFRSGVWATGYDAAFHGIANYLLKRRRKEPDLVNVVIPITVGHPDQLETTRLLEALQLKPNYVPCFATIDDLRRSVSAVASTGICLTYGDYFVRHLAEHYGVPYTREVMPQGIAGTDRWLRALGHLTERRDAAEALVRREHRRLLPQVKRLREVLHGKRLYVSAGQARAVTLAEMAKELGMELVGLTLFHYDEVAADHIQRLAAGNQDFVLNVANIQAFEQANLLNRLQPDVLLVEGATATCGAIQGFPTAAIFDYGATYLGYTGVLEIGARVAAALQNPGFAKGLARHVKLPYKESWYQQSPFKYIVQPQEQEVAHVGRAE